MRAKARGRATTHPWSSTSSYNRRSSLPRRGFARTRFPPLSAPLNRRKPRPSARKARLKSLRSRRGDMNLALSMGGRPIGAAHRHSMVRSSGDLEDCTTGTGLALPLASHARARYLTYWQHAVRHLIADGETHTATRTAPNVYRNWRRGGRGDSRRADDKQRDGGGRKSKSHVKPPLRCRWCGNASRALPQFLLATRFGTHRHAGL